MKKKRELSVEFFPGIGLALGVDTTSSKKSVYYHLVFICSVITLKITKP